MLQRAETLQFEVECEFFEQTFISKIASEYSDKIFVFIDVLVFGELKCAMEEKEVEVSIVLLDGEKIEQFEKTHLDLIGGTTS
jgi:restriction endonuclease Mrr